MKKRFIKYRKSLLAIPLAALGVTTLYGQSLQPANAELGQSQTSNVDYYASNYGIFGLDVANAQTGFIVPRGSDKGYLFGSGLWIGAKKQVSHDGGITFQEEKLSFICYNPNSATSWATPGESHEIGQPASPILYYSGNYDQQSGTSLTGSDPNWPLWLRFDERTHPLYSGMFVPVNENRTPGMIYNEPAFMMGVDEQFVSRYHDGDLERYEIGTAQATELGYPLGLQIQENIYSWNTGDPKQNVVILQYEVTNVSSEELRDCYIAQATDFDIGNAGNDRMMFYDATPGIHAGIAWTETEAKEYGLLAMILLEAPMTGPDGFVDNDLRSNFLIEGEVGTFRNWTLANDPQTSAERYDFMATGSLDSDDGGADKRALMGSRSFHMKPGDKAYFTFAFAVLEGVTVNGTNDGKGSSVQGAIIPELEDLSATLHEQYYVTGFSGQSTSSTEGRQMGRIGSAGVWPNPGSENAMLNLTLIESSDLEVRIIDNLGRTVKQMELPNAPAGSFSCRLDLSGLGEGSYLVSVRTGAEEQSTRLNVIR